MTKWLTKAELARLAGVSRAAVTKACRRSLAKACDDRGRIDAAHPVVLDYLARPATNGAGAPTTSPNRGPRTPSDPTEVDVDLLAELVIRVLTRALERAQAARRPRPPSA